MLINLCFRVGIFPAIWKKAYVRIIPKVTNPKSCDELRPILQTPCLAKVAETFITRILLDQINGGETLPPVNGAMTLSYISCLLLINKIFSEGFFKKLYGFVLRESTLQIPLKNIVKKKPFHYHDMRE